MRATSTVVVLSSLVIAVSVSAGNDKKTTPPKAGSAAGKTGSAAGSGSAVASTAGSGSGSATAPAVDPATVPPADMPTPVRMRRLEQKTQALKERAWQLKARVAMLKEQVIGGGAGAQAMITHSSEMGSSFRLTSLIYQLDGTQVFARTDETGEELYKNKGFDVFAGPIAPGGHTLVAVATYRGHGYGVFEYLSKYTFTANDTQTFSAVEGKIIKVDCRGYEKGGPTTPLEKRATLDCKITQANPAKDGGTAPAMAPTTTPPATTPAPTPEPGK